MSPDQTEESTVDWDAMLNALGDTHRRRLLMGLLDHNPQKDELHVPESVHEGEIALNRLQTEFVHKHLPLLEDEGLIRWDRHAHQVMKGPKFDEIRPFLEVVRDSKEELPRGWP